MMELNRILDVMEIEYPYLFISSLCYWFRNLLSHSENTWEVYIQGMLLFIITQILLSQICHGNIIPIPYPLDMASYLNSCCAISLNTLPSNELRILWWPIIRQFSWASRKASLDAVINGISMTVVHLLFRLLA